jgi:hypothetical protein
MKKIFLSASIPHSDSPVRYSLSADVISIRDSVRALATVALSKSRIVWGGHPSITPLIRVVAESLNVKGSSRIKLFQSAWFDGRLPDDNRAFESYQTTPRGVDEEDSIKIMRQQMLSSEIFDAGVFIGGMHGVELEADMFRELHPQAIMLPVATTGGAARLIFDRLRYEFDLSSRLYNDYAYSSLFRDLLGIDVG